MALFRDVGTTQASWPWPDQYFSYNNYYYYLSNAVMHMHLGIVNIVVNIGLTNEIELATPLLLYFPFSS